MAIDITDQGVEMRLLLEFAPLIAAIAAIGALTLGIINAFKIREVHVSINSRMDELLTQKGLASEAKGLEQGRSESRP